MKTRSIAGMTIGLLAWGSAVSAPAQADGWGVLQSSYQEVLPGGKVISQGIGLSQARGGGSGQGIIEISGLDSAYEIHKAFLYWSSYGGPAPLALLNGSQINGMEIGRDGDTCWYGGDTSNYAYRAEVTSYVTGPGSFSVSLQGQGSADPQGASLVIVAFDATAPTATQVTIADGMLTSNNAIFANLETNIGLSLPADPITTRLHVGFGDGNPHSQQGDDTLGGEGPLLLNSQQVLPPNSIEGSDGPYWDDLTAPVPASAITQSTTNAKVKINNQLDCMSWIYTALEVELPDSFGPLVRGIPDRAASSHGWHDGPVTIQWQAVDGNGANQPPDTIATLEGTHTYVSEISCDSLGNCSTGSIELSIDSEAPETNVSPMEMPLVGELPIAELKIFDAWVSGSAQDALSGISTVDIQVVDVLGNVTQVPVDWMNCNEDSTLCDFAARLEDPKDVPYDRVIVAAIDRATTLDETPFVAHYVRPPDPFSDECPAGPLCEMECPIPIFCEE